MSLYLPLQEWPLSDQQMWRSLVVDGGPLDDRGPFSDLCETSLDLALRCYGRWLRWLDQTDPKALAEAPSTRASSTRLMGWIDDLSSIRPSSRLILLTKTLRVLTAAAPDLNWEGQQRIRSNLNRSAGSGDRSRKAGRIFDSSVLFNAGLRHATVDVGSATTWHEAMKRVRNGTIIALLALMPMRRHAFANLTLGESLLINGDKVTVVLASQLTKNKRAWEAEVPAQVLPLLHRYLDEARPWFLGRGGLRHEMVWVGDDGRQFRENYFGMKIAGITTELIGVRVPPHFFRDAAATTLADNTAKGPGLIRPVLAHSNFQTAERHYINAGTIEAGRNHARLLANLKRRSHR